MTDHWPPSPTMPPRMTAGLYTNTAPTIRRRRTEKTSMTFLVVSPRYRPTRTG